MTPSIDAEIRVRHDWTRAEVQSLFDLPLPELMFRAMAVHRAVFDPGEVQLSQLLSVKTGGCAEDCGYCSQSVHFDWPQGLQADGGRHGDRRGREGEGERRAALLHGGGVAELKNRDLPELARMISGSRHWGSRPVPRSACSRPEQRSR